ncbi:plasmid mobilization protein [Salmonella enterica subsp. enterica]|nr:plasmid mobilization protein [Salmonella enterica subsp. enterica serovar Give]
MRLKFIRRDRGSFSGGLLPFLPVCCRDRDERVLAVRTMRRYGKCCDLRDGFIYV